MTDHPPIDRAGAALLAFRARHGLSVRRLAALLECPARTVSRWIYGDRSLDESPLRASTLARLGELDAAPELIGPPTGGRGGRPYGSRDRTPRKRRIIRP